MTSRLGSFFLSHRLLLGILTLAVIVRLIAAVMVDFPPKYDEQDYLAIARNIAAGVGFSIDGISPTAYRAPGYPFVVAGIFELFGESSSAVRIIQALIDTISCLLVYLLAGMLFSHRTAEVAAGMYAIFPGNLLYVPFLLSETIVTPVVLSLLVLLLRHHRTPSTTLLMWCGICAGVLVFIRPNAAVILPLFFIWTVPSLREMIPAVRTMVLIAIIAAITVSPWIIRNISQFDQPAMTSNGGVNFWIGHNEQANGSFKYSAMESPLELIPDEFDRSAEGYRLGWQFLISHPLQEVTLTALKFFHFFEPDFGLLTSVFPLHLPANGQRAVEVYKNIPAASMAAVHGTAIAVFFCAFWCLLSVTESEHRSTALLATIIIGWIVFHLFYFAVARYRVPIMPLFIILAAQAVVFPRSVVFSHPHPRYIVVTAVGALLLGSWLWIAVRLYLLP